MTLRVQATNALATFKAVKEAHAAERAAIKAQTDALNARYHAETAEARTTLYALEDRFMEHAIDLSYARRQALVHANGCPRRPDDRELTEEGIELTWYDDHENRVVLVTWEELNTLENAHV